jgi:hypothetical protein
MDPDVARVTKVLEKGFGSNASNFYVYTQNYVVYIDMHGARTYMTRVLRFLQKELLDSYVKPVPGRDEIAVIPRSGVKLG